MECLQQNNNLAMMVMSWFEEELRSDPKELAKRSQVQPKFMAVEIDGSHQPLE
ncbi:MAG: hypothetical protein KME13_15695 [Myxacorys californica WJT36-NPBG1]|jgi:hypothetical protein|nr:hypothetical protein [Myxacorys californica WJT36-NPBG1]